MGGGLKLKGVRAYPTLSMFLILVAVGTVCCQFHVVLAIIDEQRPEDDIKLNLYRVSACYAR